jgi:ABC-type transport system substrate-binding protein
MSILDQVENEIKAMTPEQIQEALKAALAQAEERKAKQKEYQAKVAADPTKAAELKEKRTAYSKLYQEKVKSDPEKAAKMAESRKAYNTKPEVVARRKEYTQKRNAQLKLLKARAAELGIDVSTLGTSASA